MLKHVLVISATPRFEGNSDVLCDRFIAGAKEAGHLTDKVSLRSKNIGYCTGCGVCFNTQKPCPFKDDSTTIISKMVVADVIVLATPVYFYSMNGQLKTLIDRTCARYNEMIGKDFYFIATAADDNVAALNRAVDGLRAFISCLDSARERGVIYGSGTWQIGDIRNHPALEEAYRMGLDV